MKLVIDIPESTYEVCKSYLNYKSDNAFAEKIKQSIANGILLPKGHGRLIDADELKKVINQFDYYDQVSDAPTIIKSESEE